MELRKGGRKRKQRHGRHRGSSRKAREPAGQGADIRRDAAIGGPGGGRRRPADARAAAAGSEQPAPGRLSRRPPVGASVRRGPREPRSPLARSLRPPSPARLPASVAPPRTTCGPLSVYQASRSRAPRLFRPRAPRPGSGPGATVLKYEAPAGEKNAPGGLGLHLRGSPSPRASERLGKKPSACCL